MTFTMTLPYPPSNRQTSKFNQIRTLHLERSRNAATEQLHHQQRLAFEEKRRKMGSIKSYTYQLTKSQKWTPNDFERTKTELRKKYKVRKVKTMQAIEKMSKSEMLGYLDYFSHSYRKIAPKKSKETRKSVCTE